MTKLICPTEDQEQINLMIWASYHPICKHYLIHIPNGGSRDKREAAKLKRMGVKAGVSDLFLAYPICAHGNTTYSGLWIELKRRKGAKTSLSKAQKEWMDLMEKQGYLAYVAYGWDHARQLIEYYLSLINK